MAFATIHYFRADHWGRLRPSTSSSPTTRTIPRPWAVFYLLHGLSDDHTIWQRRTSIERYVEGASDGRRHARRRAGAGTPTPSKATPTRTT